MPQADFQTRPVPATTVEDFCTQLLEAAGLRPDDARLVAASLVAANLRGIDSHGVARLPHYLKRIELGSIKPRPELRVEKLAPAAARLDADHGLGQIAMQRATEEAIALARAAGAGWVALHNSTHCGALAYFGLQIAQAGMIGLAFTHVGALVLPFGSRQPFCGTNPICITAPGQDGEDLCLDMATSVAPWNAVANAAMEGAAIPQGWAVDAAGEDTTDPAQAAALRAFGGYKGSGLGLMIDVLCALLSGSRYGPDIHKMYGDLTQRRELGGLIGAIDVGHFVEVDTFRGRVLELIQRWTALPPAEGHQRVLYPGQPERLTQAMREQEGVPLGLNLIAEFDALGAKYGLSDTLSAGL